MNDIVNIYGTDIQVKIWNGQKVVTFADIDKVHKRADRTMVQWKENNKYSKNKNLYQCILGNESVNRLLCRACRRKGHFRCKRNH